MSKQQGRAARDNAMSSAHSAAAELWKLTMWEIIVNTCKRKREFTVDDIWDRYYEIPSPPCTHENRALGPLMMRAAKDGLCEKTGRSTQCRRRNCHAADIAIWRSLVVRRKT
jgi:hypothetical protein